jgi:predicted DNA-binding transcriptional regulator YafY
MALIVARVRSIRRNENADLPEAFLPNKLDPYRSYGGKLISLFARLMFSSESHSLTDLARLLGCSKQTVLRLVDDIRRAYGVEIEESIRERRKYFRLKKKIGKIPAIPITTAEITTLQMCKAFAEHLLGPELLKEATQAIEKSSAQLPNAGFPSNGFAVLPIGTIDYTPHQQTLQTLIKAMGELLICKVTYKAGYDGRAKTFFIKPLKLFSHKDCLYLSTQMARYPGRKYKEPDYEPLLAVHRIGRVELTDRRFERPKSYDFNARFSRDFGVIKEEPFTVTADFRNWAATYVSERIWSPDQEVIRRKDGSIRLKFKASSEMEVISWVLSFRSDCTLVKPKRLVNKLRETMREIFGSYSPAAAALVYRTK